MLSFGHVMPSALASHAAYSVISGTISSMALSMACDTDARTGTRINTKSHMISLNNHFNMTNKIVSLMAPSA